MIDPKLKEFATPRQKEYIEAVESEGTQQKAAEKLGINLRALTKGLGNLKKKAIQHGYSPEHDWVHDVPPGYKVKGTSTYYDQDGEVKGQWVKSQIDNERFHIVVREIIDGLMDEIIPCQPVKTPKTDTNTLLTAYNIGDAHLGMYGWGEETGEDFDCRIAENDLISAVDRLISSAPKSDECLINQLGDFFHMDDSRSVTPKSANQLDTDTRYKQVIRIGIRVMRYFIDSALKTHKIVRVRNVAGNHDPHSSVALEEGLKGYYSREKRVIIEDSPKAFFTYRFGNNLIGITHGHAPRPDKLPGVMAVDAMQNWGECHYKYIWHGHIHNKRVFEEMGCIVESFRTLAPGDAWIISEGYRAGREIVAIILDKEYGEIERHTRGIRNLRETA